MDHEELLRNITAQTDKLHARINSLGQETSGALGDIRTDIAVIQTNTATNKQAVRDAMGKLEGATLKISEQGTRLAKIETEKTVIGALIKSPIFAWISAAIVTVGAWFSTNGGHAQ